MKDLNLVLADIEVRLIESSSGEESVNESSKESGLGSELRDELDSLYNDIERFLAKLSRASNSSKIPSYAKQMAKESAKDFKSAIGNADGVILELSMV